MKALVLHLFIAGSLLTACSTVPREPQEDKWGQWDFCEQWAYDGESWMQCMTL